MTDFINDVSKESFEMFNTKDSLTFKSLNNDKNIDFSDKIADYNTIFYQGISSSLKIKIKENSIIEYVDFNDYDIDDTNFVFDNYLSMFDENIVLVIPEEINEYIKENNHLLIHYDGITLEIPVDKVILSKDRSFSIYCNNISYLNNYFLLSLY